MDGFPKMIDHDLKKAAAEDLARVADDIFNGLAFQFPVCMSSDEFHFFPQFKPMAIDWTRWDDFSPDAVADAARRIAAWRKALSDAASRRPAEADAVEIALLDRILTTLREQLQEVRPHRSQPTFSLTIAAVGLAEAIESDPEHLEKRMQGLPRFLERILAEPDNIPMLYAELGFEMIAKLQDWLPGLARVCRGTTAVMAALDRLKTRLNRTPKKKAFRLSPHLYAAVVANHIGCGMPVEEVRAHLNLEVEETTAVLAREARRISPAATWQQAVAALPRPTLPPQGLIGLYREAIEQLGAHCAEVHFMSPAVLTACPVNVTKVPEYLTPVRSAAAYSMPPGHPPSGGTFYITASEDANAPPRDLRLLTAHETFPGHHLLDLSRWRLSRQIRRHIEFPIFYEGWASFSEEILFDTGFFSCPADRLLMAKRRYWRAIRGLVDLDIHSGTKPLSEAVGFLRQSGLPHPAAEAMARRYALKPGYQLCYTIGRRKFKSLYARFLNGRRKPADFVRAVLASGEIGFDQLTTFMR
jgi:uncharacterized protein (DUF885 family)